MLVVDKSYFTSGAYITQDEFCTLWQSCLNVDYRPIVDIRVLKEPEKGKGKEVAEVAKYTIKSTNILADLRGISDYSQDIIDEAKRMSDVITDEIVFTLDEVLAYRRLIGYGGIFKTKHKELNLDDADNGDLINAGDSAESKGENFQIERYRWDIGFRNYVMIEDIEEEEHVS